MSSLAEAQPLQDVDIEEADPQDLLSIIELEKRVSLEIYPNPQSGITPEDIMSAGFGGDRARMYMDRYFDPQKGNIWIAKVDGQVVGFSAAGIEDNQNWIDKLYVDPSHQKAGIGSRLLASAEDWLGAEKDIVVGVESHNQNAMDFYFKHGYQIQGPRPEAETTVPSGKVIPETLLIKPKP